MHGQLERTVRAAKSGRRGTCENPAVLLIPPHVYAALRRHGEEIYPEESCGALLGRLEYRVTTVAAAVACTNARRDSPRNRYAIDPKELVRIQTEARGHGWDIVGFYHSHPDHAAAWSSTDLAEAHWIGCSYVITRVDGGRAAETRSFLLTGAETGAEDEKCFEEEAIELVHHQMSQEES